MSLPPALRVEGDGGVFGGGVDAVVVVLVLVGSTSCEVCEELAVAVAVNVAVGLGLEEASSRAAKWSSAVVAVVAVAAAAADDDKVRESATAIPRALMATKRDRNRSTARSISVLHSTRSLLCPAYARFSSSLSASRSCACFSSSA